MSPAASITSEPLFDHVVVVGVGLIGGSIAKALKTRGVARKVTGLGRNRERLLDAQRAGLLDAVATSESELKPFDLAVVCTPVDRIVADVRALQAVAPPKAIITDVGSVKGRICRELSVQTPGVATFLGSPPMNLVESGNAVVGFRPEHFRPAGSAPAGGQPVHLKVRCSHEEYLGAERILYGLLEGGPFDGKKVVARLPSTHVERFAAGSASDFEVAEKDLKFFDREKGTRTARVALA